MGDDGHHYLSRWEAIAILKVSIDFSIDTCEGKVTLQTPQQTALAAWV